MRVGILGGTFNPPHLGHLALARTVLDLELADAVLFIPAAVPPHKATPLEADSRTRLAMTRLLAEEDSRFRVDDLELERQGPSFTIDTVRELAARHPEDSFRLVIGSDMARTFGTWREYGELLRLAPPLVAQRPDVPLPGNRPDVFPGLTDEERDIVWSGRFPMLPVDISSTKIRELLADGADDKAMLAYLTARVLGYIREHRLYACRG